MKTYIYKMTHLGDPDLRLGIFGCRGCKGIERNRDFNAVIGIGSEVDRRAIADCIAGRLVWIGIGPEEIGAEVKRAPVLKFAHFLPLPLKYVKLRNHYPALAWVMFDGPNYHRAAFMHTPGSNPGLDVEVAQILELAKDAPPSLWGVDCSLDRRVSC